jgi:hypothetical protein
MNAFNAFYYSFSPGVAELVAGSPLLQSVVRALIYPLLASLRLAAHLGQLYPEASQSMIVIAGVLASGLVGMAYLTPVAILLKVLHRKVKFLGGV